MAARFGGVGRDRALAAAGLASLAVLAWAHLVQLAWRMDASGSGAQLAMPHTASWGGGELILTLSMWCVMMVAMMVPSAAPIVLFTIGSARTRGGAHPLASAAAVLAGYLLVWIGFSAAATAAQWGLHEAALVSPMGATTSPLLGAGLLAAAGVFQMTPLKRACLARCRSPLGFLMTEWRSSRWGQVVMGLKHGAYCVGCCWILMALLFVAGVMNLLWVALIAAFVLVERVAPHGDRLGRLGGVFLLAAGLWLLIV